MGASATAFLDGSLKDWDEVESLASWDALLLGNGMSVNIWPKFGYDSLFGEAILSAEDVESFKALGTENFEVVLESLDRAILLAKASSMNSKPLRVRRTSIRRALGRTVNHVHVSRSKLDDDRTLRPIRKAFRQHKWVFTTSYDLLAYYAMAVEDFFGFVDFFWGSNGVFNEASIIEDWIGDRTRVLFLHGAVHLVQLSDDRACKRKQTMFSGLLDLFEQPHAGDKGARPLIVTEGQSNQKASQIAQNEYLSFANRMLRECDAPLVIFGHSVSEQDQHLIDAINLHPGRPLAVSLRDQGKRKNKQRMLEIKSRLPDNEIYFFKADTHPLGDKDLRVMSAIKNPFARRAASLRAAS